MNDPACLSLLTFLDGIASARDCLSLQQRVSELPNYCPDITSADVVHWTRAQVPCTGTESLRARPPALVVDEESIANSALASVVVGRQPRVLCIAEIDKFIQTYPECKSLREKWIELGIRHFYAVPITKEPGCDGLILFGSSSAEAFPSGVTALIQRVGSLIAACIDADLHSQKIERLEHDYISEGRRLRTLLEVNNSLISHLGREELVEAITVVLRRVIGAEYSAVSVYNPDAKSLEWLTVHLPGKTWKSDFGLAFLLEMNNILISTPVTTEWLKIFTALARKNGYSDIAVYDKFAKSLRWLGMNDLDGWAHRAEAAIQCAESPSFIACRRSVGRRVHVGLTIPLIARGSTVGVLNIAHERQESTQADEALLLHDIAGQVALAVENTLAFNKINLLKEKLANEKLYLEEEIRRTLHFDDIVSESSALQDVLSRAELVAESDATVLLLGETGTGKELIARAIHNLSSRKNRTLVKVNCAAIPAGLLESELFGHERGSFTGATSARMGRFELANQGTLFLDEIGELPIELQPKLLRAIQEKEFERVGGNRPIKADVRIIAATNRNLERMVTEGSFRADLYYRLNVFPIVIPPLRERPEDIPPLVRYFTARYAKQMKRGIELILPETMDALKRMPWKGNVRELENVIERAVILSRGSALNVPFSELCPVSPEVPLPQVADKQQERRDDSMENLVDVERQHILRVLREMHGVVGGPKGAAVRLGLKRSTLVSKMRRLGISSKTLS